MSHANKRAKAITDEVGAVPISSLMLDVSKAISSDAPPDMENAGKAKGTHKARAMANARPRCVTRTRLLQAKSGLTKRKANAVDSAVEADAPAKPVAGSSPTAEVCPNNCRRCQC